MDHAGSSLEQSVLDNPVWNSLTGRHAHLAVGAGMGSGLARRYPANAGPLSAFRVPTSEAFADLAAIVPEGDVAVLFLEDLPEIPAEWQVLRKGRLAQMVCPTLPDQPAMQEAIARLESADVPEMIALAALAEPGPFREQTAMLGRFLGIRVHGRLAAMAGQRLAPAGYVEVSAVCTHPGFRGRGYAEALVAAIARDSHAEGVVPFLTALESNTQAIRVYERVGFVRRRTLELAVVKPPSSF